MTNFVLRIYNFLRRHAALRIAALVISSAVIIFFGVQVEYEEDISKLLPSTNNGNEKLAFANLRVKDKIFVLFAPQDGAQVDPDELVEMSDAFTEQLLLRDSATHYIDDILYKLDEEVMMDAISYLCDNFPIFVDETSYATIDSLLSEENILEQMDANYEMLTSSAGMMMKDMIANDPIGLRTIIFKKFNEIKSGLGSNQTMYDSHFFTPDTTVAIAYISPSFKSFDSKSGTKLVELIESQIEAFREEYPEVNIWYHGAPVQSVYNSRQIKKDLSLTISISLIVVCLIIGICFKNKSTLPLLVAPVIYGTFFSLTMMYFVKGTMSLLALGIGAIVLGVALSYCLHVITHYKYVSTPERVIRDQAKPVFLGCLTTIGSFLGLMFTQSELLQDFGLFASFALIGTTFFSLIFLPHFFNAQRNRKSKKAFRMLERFNSHPFEKHKWLIAAIVVICAVCFYTQRFVTFDSNLKNIGYFEPKIMKSMDILAEKTQPGCATTYYASSSYDLDSALMSSRQMSLILDSLKSIGKISGYSKAASLFMTEEEQLANIDRWSEYWTDDKVADVMQKVEKACSAYGISPAFFRPFENMLTSDYETISLYEDGIIPDGLLANMIECTDSIYMVFTPVQLKVDDQREVGLAVTTVPDCVVIDPMFYTSEMVQTINNDFNIALKISMAFVFIVLLLSFKNLLLAILAFIPMTLSWFIVLGVMGICGLQFNLINIVISTFIFGIGVDYSIFVMDGLLSKAKSQSEPRLLVYHKTAIFFSAIVLFISTGSLILATHPAIASIGIATIIGMSAAVILAYTLQPFLYHMVVRFMLKRGIKAKWLEDSNNASK